MEGIRRKEKEIKDIEEIKRVLGSTQYMTIAMCDNNQPYLVTLSHGYDSEKNCLYFHCAPQGKKINILESNNKIWGQVIVDYGYVQGKCDHLYVSVHFTGRVIFIEDLEEKKHALEVMIRQLEKNPEEVMAKQMGEDSVKNVKIGRIDIKNFSGKKINKIETN